MSNKPIALAADHGGFRLKTLLIETLQKAGHEVLDLGTNDGTTSVDYPDFAEAMADALAEGKAEFGVLICGTGIGISIAANRHRHVRAALVQDVTSARLCREHNNANVIVFGGRTTGDMIATECLEVFLKTAFEGGRHEKRLVKFS